MSRTSKNGGSKKQTPKSLLAVVDRFNALVIPAQRLANDMNSLGIRSIDVGCQSSLETAIDRLTVWVAACEKAWNDKMKEDGLLSGESEDEESDVAQLPASEPEKPKKQKEGLLRAANC